MAIELAPPIGALYTTRGLVRAGRADTAGALADLERAIEVDPRTSMPRAHLASILEGLGRREEAIAGIAEAVRLDPDDTLARTIRAPLRKSAGDPEGAIRDLDRAIESEPTRPTCSSTGPISSTRAATTMERSTT